VNGAGREREREREREERRKRLEAWLPRGRLKGGVGGRWRSGWLVSVVASEAKCREIKITSISIEEEAGANENRCVPGDKRQRPN
jgi:hypothetical protein